MSRLTMVERPELQESLGEVYRLPGQLRHSKQIRVASFNVYNLFDEDSPHAAPKAQLKALGEVILALDADVIAFAEAQNERVLRSLFRTYVNPKLDDTLKYDGYVCLAGNDRRGINVALVTRLSIRGAMTFNDVEFESADGKAVKFARDLLGVKIQMTPNSAHTYIHFAAHLKSKIGGAAADERRGIEAGEIVKILSGDTFGPTPFTAQNILLSGDMNDEPDTAVVRTLQAEGLLADALADVTPNHTYPTAIKASPTGRKPYPDARLDYLFASASIAPRLSEMTIHRTDAADRASDHYPISAVLRVE